MFVKFKTVYRCNCCKHKDNAELEINAVLNGMVAYKCKKCSDDLIISNDKQEFLDRFLSTNELKRIMNITKQGLDFLRNKGVLVMIKQDGRWMMDIEEFRKFIETRRGVVDARYKFTV